MDIQYIEHEEGYIMYYIKADGRMIGLSTGSIHAREELRLEAERRLDEYFKDVMNGDLNNE